jgi:hypothetical protein
MRRALLLSSLFFAAAGARASDQTVALPPGDAPSGWCQTGQTRVFTGSGLYGHIDGGAEIFFEFGFEELTVQRYSSGRDAMEVELYRMTDAAAALGIYLQRCANRCEPPGTYLGFPTYTTIGRVQAMFVQGRFLAIATQDGVSGSGATAMRELASRLTKRLPPDSPPAPDAVLPPGWIPGSLRLIRGPLALQAIVTLGDGDILRLGGRLTAAAADYPDAPGRPAHTLVVVDYLDQTAARAAFHHLRAGLDAEIKPLREAAGWFVFRDYAGRFGLAASEGTRLTLRLNLVNDPGP